MIIENSFKQGDEKWHKARLNSVGGTGISKIITSTGKRSKSREKYLYEKASQSLTGQSKPLFKTYEMQWGTDHEAEARDLFAFSKDVEVSECAMVWLDEDKKHHISPDGLMLDLQEGLEIKCPQLQTHDDYLESGKLPTQYKLQVQTSLALTGWEVWHFLSYFPGVKPFFLEVQRDEELIKIIKVEIKLFLKDLQQLIKKLEA